MSEDTMKIEAEQIPQKEKPSAVIRGVQMPAHQVRKVIAANVAAGRITEDEGETIFWLYAFGQEYHLNYDELGKAAELSAATVVESPVATRLPSLPNTHSLAMWSGFGLVAVLENVQRRYFCESP